MHQQIMAAAYPCRPPTRTTDSDTSLADSDETAVSCAECDGAVSDSAHYSAADWGVCEACWTELSPVRRDSIIDSLPTPDDA